MPFFISGNLRAILTPEQQSHLLSRQAGLLAICSKIGVMDERKRVLATVALKIEENDGVHYAGDIAGSGK